MHSMISKLKLTSFDAKVQIFGREVSVGFGDGSDRSGPEYTEPSSLVVRGLTMDEAMNLLELVGAPTSKAPAAGVPAHHESRAADEKRRADAALAKARAAAPPTQPAAAVPVEPEPEPEPDDDLDADGDGSSESEAALDVSKMDKMDKLRSVIEYMVKVGFTTPEQIVAAAGPIKDRVKVLKVLDEKGSFDKRLERAAITVLAQPDAA